MKTWHWIAIVIGVALAARWIGQAEGAAEASRGLRSSMGGGTRG